MRIIGLDVGKNSVVACVLEKQPEDLKTYLRQSKEFMEFKATVEGIKNLLEIPFDIAIIEPTGIHYSKLWGETIEANGREVRWISHQAVANHRKSNRLPNKNDKADALGSRI
jgi:transposase